MELDFKMFGDNVIKTKLSRFMDHIKNFKTLFEVFTKEFQNIMREQFASEGSHSAGGWTPLSAKYAEWKSKNRPGRTILVSYGNMYSSLVKTGDKNNVTDISEDEMKIGTRDPIAVYHHKGMGRLPAREIVKFSKEDNTRWVKQAHEWLFVQLRKKGIGL